MKRFVYYLFVFFFFGGAILFSPAPASAAHFSASLAPASGTIDTGQQFSFVTSATCTSGPCEAVDFFITPPAGATIVSFSTPGCAAGWATCSSVITIDSGTAAAGLHTFSPEVLGSHSASALYSLTITDPTQPQPAPRTWSQTDNTAATNPTSFNWTGVTGGTPLNTNAAVVATGGGALQLPPNTFGDDFSGAAVDTTKWFENPTVTQSGGIATATTESGGTAGTWHSAGLTSRYTFSTDFDVQVSLAPVSPTNSGSISLYASIAGLGGIEWFLLTGYRLQLWEATTAGCTDNRPSITGAVSLRFIRSGTTLYAYYRTTGGWILSNSCSNVTTGNTTIGFYVTNRGNVAVPYSATFDNFIISSPTYITNAVHSSGTFDVTSQQSDFTTLSWTQSLPSAATTVNIKLATANNPTGPWTFLGPDGTAGTSYACGTATCSIPIADAHDGNQFMRYQATLNTTNGLQTPRLDDITIGYKIPSSFNFSASLSSSSGRVMRSGSLPISPGITATLSYGTAPANPVSFTVNPAYLPAGVTVSFGTPSCSLSCASSFTVSANSSAPLGKYVFPLQARVDENSDGMYDIIKEATFEVEITEPFSFDMRWSVPASCAGATACSNSSSPVPQGGTTQGTFTVRDTRAVPEPATAEQVTYDYSPKTIPGVSVGFSYTSCQPDCTVTATLYTSSATPYPGPHAITITGTTAGGLTDSITFSLYVAQGFVFTFEFQDGNDAQLTTNLTAAAYANDTATPLPTIVAKYTAGATGSVTFSITNPCPAASPCAGGGVLTITNPDGALTGCSFTVIGQTCVRPAAGPFTISSSSMTPGTYPITFTATPNLGQPQNISYNLTILGPFDFTMQFSPSTGNFDENAIDPVPQDTRADTVTQGNPVLVNVVITPNQAVPPALPETITITPSVSPATSDISLPPPATCTTGTDCQLLIFSVGTAPTAEGVYPITFTATGGSPARTHRVRLNLTVTAPPPDYNIRGWAWSDGAGWISFNSQNCDTNNDGRLTTADRDNPTSPNAAAPDACLPANVTWATVDAATILVPFYGTHMDFSSYELSGYAWSEQIGWLTFERSIAGTPPAAPYNGSESFLAVMNTTTGRVEGWARAVSCSWNEPSDVCDAVGESGWIKMSN